MIDRINDLLFHPSTLKKFKDIHLFKAFLYLIIIAIFSSLVTFIDLVTFDGFTIHDQKEIERILDIDFKVVNQLPDCKVENNTLSCENPDEVTNLGTGVYDIVFIVDQNENFKMDGAQFYVILTENNIRVANRFSSIRYSYNELPSEWQSFDFTEIKNSNDPQAALVDEFVGGFNKLFMPFIPLIMIFEFFGSYFMVLLQTIFYSFIIYLFYRRFPVRFKEIFKITIFAQTFPVILSLIFTLLGITNILTMIPTALTLIYVHKALFSGLTKK